MKKRKQNNRHLNNVNYYLLSSSCDLNSWLIRRLNEDLYSDLCYPLWNGLAYPLYLSLGKYEKA